jgi:hypothetical protein
MDDVSNAKAALKSAKGVQLAGDLWQQALQAGRQARVDEMAQREASAKPQPRQDRQQ